MMEGIALIGILLGHLSFPHNPESEHTRRNDVEQKIDGLVFDFESSLANYLLQMVKLFLLLSRQGVAVGDVHKGRSNGS